MTGVARQKKRLAVILAVTIGIGLIVALRRPRRAEVPLLDGTTVTVVPGVHLLGGLGPSAAYAVETSEGLLLIDTGIESNAAPLLAKLAKLGLDVKALRGIFLTHAHIDHCGGAQHLKSLTGATIYAGQGDAPALKAGVPREAFFSTYPMPDHLLHPTTIDVELKGGERIPIGDVQLQVFDAPGHTPGSICYLMDRAGLRVLFGGDVIHRLDEQPLGTYSAYLPPRYRGDAGSYLATLRKFRELAVPDLVLPGHPSDHSTPRSPRLTPQQWAEMLDRGIDEMERLVARYAADGAGFLDGNPKRLLPDLYYLGDFQGSALYGFFAESKFFLVDAPGGTGLIEFVRSSQRQLGLTATDPAGILLTDCGQNETAGLAELVNRCAAQVVAAPAGVELVQRSCPPDTVVRSTEDLPEMGWFPVTPILLGGRGLAPTGYLLPWAGKTVFLSGRIPTTSDVQSRRESLFELGGPGPKARAYVDSLRQLASLNPDLWLPAVPLDGQNANLYDHAWRDVLELNCRDVFQGAQRR